MVKFYKEAAPQNQPTNSSHEPRKFVYVEPEAPVAGKRVIDVSNRTYVPPPGNIKVVRGEFNERVWRKAARIQSPW